ncbi:MAG: phosphoribosylformylglycinamidine synthase subunit PurQ [Candidatus Kapabacteria bacterium]|nr:phosphoribosylformylglycinamidine synthase subunit PurQ [Candidatus Kapabacteria bacterium]
MKFGVVIFPGSNCDHDAINVASSYSETYQLWHKDTSIPNDIDCIILPGGFSFGDYLRCGAIAKFSPIMNEVIKFANNGKYVIGICNGFQILTEAGLVPGALIRNNSLHFLCKDIYLKTENTNSIFTSELSNQNILKLPIAHGEGNFIVDDNTLTELESNSQIAFRYCDKDGNVIKESNPNGSVSNIAGVLNKKKNVLGLMPHPERYSDNLLGYNDGKSIFDSIFKNLN